MKRLFNLTLSYNEIDYTIVLILLAKIMLCSKPHCQKTFKLRVLLREMNAELLPYTRYNGSIFAYGQTGSGKTFTMQVEYLSLSFPLPVPLSLALSLPSLSPPLSLSFCHSLSLFLSLSLWQDLHHAGTLPSEEGTP